MSNWLNANRSLGYPMTFKCTVKDKSTGLPVEGVIITANLETMGLTFTRSSDGNGYSDLSVLEGLGHGIPAGLPVVISVIKEGYKVWSSYETGGLELKTSKADQTVEIFIDPF